MSNEQYHFILAGNGPYENRGCEAIVRGTVLILRHYFNDPRFMVISHYESKSQFEQQKSNEVDEAITHTKTIFPLQRFSTKRLLLTSLRLTYPKMWRYFIYKEMFPYLKKANAVLSIGGDNYSLDYGIPKIFTGLDDLVLSSKKPIIIWGSSVGPFSKIPTYEKYILKHLQTVTAIFARESQTIEYLSDRGITGNVYRVADPAFLLKPQKPSSPKFSVELLNEGVGINLSPLMAKFIKNSDDNRWLHCAAKIIKEISRKTQRPIYLIPHVNNLHSNDHEFLAKIITLVDKTKEKIELIPPFLNAAELKWVISKMAVFAGARTHATIASLSSSVPTLSFAYSIKAKGINRDIFGHTKYCLDPDHLIPEIVAEKIAELIENSESIKDELNLKVPKMQDLAMTAGRYLKDILGV